MKVGFIFFALAAFLASCAPGATFRNNHLQLEVAAVSPTRANIFVTEPASFPDPENRHVIPLDCTSNTGLRFLAAEGRRNFRDYRRFEASQPGLLYNNKRFTLGDVSIFCSKGYVVYKAANMDDLLTVLSLGGGVEEIGATNGALEFVLARGYRYPNIREGFFSHSLYVQISQGIVSGYHDSYPVIVTLQQGEQLQPVWFEDRYYRAEYNPNQDATLFVDRGVWDSVTFNYARATLTWNRSGSRPY